MKNFSSINIRLNETGNKRRACYRGIKNYLTKEDAKFLWFRDKAYKMIKPSIDRKNPKKHYTLSNCRFLEFRVNASGNLKDKNSHYLNIYHCNVSDKWFGERCIDGRKKKTKTCYSEREAVKEYQELFKEKPLKLK